MLDSYHMTLKLLLNRVFVLETLRFCYYVRILLQPLLHNVNKICKPLVVYRCYCMAVISLPGARRHMIKSFSAQNI